MGVAACQQAHGPKGLLLRAGLQLQFEPFQDALHNFLHLQGRAGRTSVVPSFLPSLLLPLYSLLRLKGLSCNPVSDSRPKPEFWGARGQTSRGRKRNSRSSCQGPLEQMPAYSLKVQRGAPSLLRRHKTLHKEGKSLEALQSFPSQLRSASIRDTARDSGTGCGRTTGLSSGPRISNLWEAHFIVVPQGHPHDVLPLLVPRPGQSHK